MQADLKMLDQKLTVLMRSIQEGKVNNETFDKVAKRTEGRKTTLTRDLKVFRLEESVELGGIGPRISNSVSQGSPKTCETTSLIPPHIVESKSWSAKNTSLRPMDYPSEANGWYIYGPHFTRFPIAPTHGGYAAAGREVELVPLQSTWLKRTTELSEELPPAQRRWLPARERLTVQGSPLGGLVRASGAEGRRLERAVDEEVHRSSEGLAKQVDHLPTTLAAGARTDGSTPGHLFEALLASLPYASSARDWPGQEKLYIRPHERLRLGTAGLPAPEGHLQVDLEPVELERLRATEPRSPLCRYFSADPLRLQQDRRSGGFTAATWRLLQLGLRSGPRISAACGLAHRSVGLGRLDWEQPCGLESRGPLRALDDLRFGTTHLRLFAYANQLPFLQHLQLSGETRLRILPVGVGAVALSEAQQLANQLAALVRSVEHGHQVVVIGTTDFSHEGPSYGGRCMFVPEITRLTKEKDKPLLEAVRAMDVENPGDVE
eukprot:g22264.t1